MNGGWGTSHINGQQRDQTLILLFRKLVDWKRPTDDPMVCFSGFGVCISAIRIEGEKKNLNALGADLEELDLAVYCQSRCSLWYPITW